VLSLGWDWILLIDGMLISVPDALSIINDKSV